MKEKKIFYSLKENEEGKKIICLINKGTPENKMLL